MTLIPLLMLMTFTFHGEEMTEKGLSPNTCTAVMISPNLALTASHCVKDLALVGKQTAEDSKGKTHKATYIAADPNLDLALIKISGGPYTYAKLGALPKRGETVMTLNSGENMPNTFNTGIVCNLLKDKDYYGIPMIVHNVAILHGASGSGLFNSKGELVGINVLSLPALSEAVDVNAIRMFLKRHYVAIG
jgi:S1-C subfamily serine protease